MRLLLTFLGTVLLITALDNRLGQLPPLGRFLDPINGFYQNAAIPFSARDSDTFQFDQLKEAAAVQFDEYMVPHIQAGTSYDLYFLQGYVTARHRLWQMEVQTHFAAGRLTEIFGESMLDTDRLTRRKGLVTGAKEALAAMQRDAETAEAVQAFSDGVNAYISRLDYRHKPFEYKLLGYDPEPWTPLKSALLLMYMAEDLAGYDVDLENTNLLNLLGREDFNLLYPDRLPDSDPIAPAGTSWNFGALPLKERPVSYPNLSITDTLPKPNPANGSNNWAVSGSKTSSGRPILCNDPHLSLNLPSIWYALQLSGPGLNVYGVSLPGAPGVIIGFNDSIAWGVTNAQRDVKDWYRIHFKDSSRQAYAFDGQWLQTEKVAEQFRFRPGWFWQSGDTFTDTVVYTRHGPLVYDRNFPKKREGQNFAMRWVAHQPGNSLKAFMLLNRARNFEEYSEALNHYNTPAQNFVFASVSGDIALRVQGKFPAKWQDQGRFLMEGNRSDFEWQDFIPATQNVLVKNPERGFVSSANQIPADSLYPYYIFDQTFEHYRNRRINQQLQHMENISTKDMMQLQNDNYHLMAAETLPWMMEGVNTNLLRPEERRAMDQLQQWDFMALASQPAPAIYHAWWRKLKALTFDELDSLEIAVIQPSDAAMAYFLKNNPSHPLLNVSYLPGEQNLQDLLLLSFREMVKDLAEWEQTNERPLSWGDYKNSSIMHLSGQAALSYTKLQIDGGKNIVNANSGRHGASWRMVVALGEPMEAWGIYPGGQSGNPGSPYYDTFLESWRQGEYKRLYFITDQTPFADKIIFTHTFSPPQQP
jgi:penicillin G amidase